MLGENIHTIKKNKEALLQASREVGLEVNTEKTKYMFVSPPECRTKSYINNRSSENVATFKYFGMTVTNQN
jgi:hypothetical protein